MKTFTPYLPPPPPTFTPIPYARAVDLDPAFPEQDKYYVEVYRCDGVFETWILGLWRSLDSIPLQPGDQIIRQMVGQPGTQATLHLPPPLASPYPTPLSPALDYDSSPDSVLLYANNRPGGFPHLGEMPSCSRIPHPGALHPPASRAQNRPLRCAGRVWQLTGMDAPIRF